MKKLLAFDLDDTLAVTKSPIDDRMASVLVALLDYFDVCIISGGKIEQFMQQVVDRLQATDEQLSRLHLMPTCGTRYYKYLSLEKRWHKQYAEDLSTEDKDRIATVLEACAREFGIWPEEPYGDVVEDRGSQVSISMLGQLAPAEAKYAWAEKYSQQRMAVREAAAKQLIEFEVRAGGSTTIDVTRIGIDKAYGMRKLTEELKISKEDILFFGDKLQEGGNDYPVRAMGIDSLEVSHWQDTVLCLEAILATIS